MATVRTTALHDLPNGLMPSKINVVLTVTHVVGPNLAGSVVTSRKLEALSAETQRLNL